MSLTSPSARPRKIGIELFRLGDWLLGDFVDGRGRGLLFAETVAGAEGFELIQADCVDNVVVQAAQARVGVEVISAGEQLVERFVKLLARLAEMAGLEILLARIERGLAVHGKLLRAFRLLNGKRRQSFVLRIERQRGKIWSCDGKAIWAGRTCTGVLAESSQPARPKSTPAAIKSQWIDF